MKLDHCIPIMVILSITSSLFLMIAHGRAGLYTCHSLTVLLQWNGTFSFFTMKRRFLEDTWRKEPSFQGLCKVLLSCRTQEDMENFLRDIGTLSELQAWSERLEVAKLLARGLSYRQVAEQTKASTTTVTRVAKFMENGEGGYRKALRIHRHYREVPDLTEPLLKPKMVVPVAVPASVQPEPIEDVPKPASALQKYLGRR